MDDQKIINFGMRIGEALHAKLKKIAKNDQRSLHGFIIKTLSDVVKDYEKES